MSKTKEQWEEQKGMSPLALLILSNSPARKVALGAMEIFLINVEGRSQTPVPRILTGDSLESKGLSKT